MTNLSEKFGEGLQFAFDAHRRQKRKGTDVPYITHLMAVAAIVGENGGDEDLMIAALLHDAMEDQGVSRKEIAGRFGERVACIVESCSDTTVQPKPPWRERKKKYIEHLRGADSDVRLVSLADKIHNARSILNDLQRDGAGVWGRFTAGPQEILWYYRSVLQALRNGWDHPLISQLEQVVREVERLVEKE